MSVVFQVSLHRPLEIKFLLTLSKQASAELHKKHFTLGLPQILPEHGNNTRKGADS